MEQNTQDIWLRIQCPQCGARYRIERSKIPEAGATIKCRKCQHPLVLRREQSAAPAAQPPPARADLCPKCGFDQKQGEFCYKCGTRIRQLEKNQTESNPVSELPVGMLEAIVEYQKTSFYLSIMKPVIEIDKEQYIRPWGPEQFQLPPGKYTVRFYLMFLGRRFCEKFHIFEIEKDHYLKIQYLAAPMGGSRIKLLKNEKNAIWRSLISRKKATPQKLPFTQKPFFVILMLVTSFPVGVYYLWKSKHFSDTHKWIIAAISLVAFIYFLYSLKLPFL